MKYKLIERKNPQNPQAPSKLCATLVDTGKNGRAFPTCFCIFDHRESCILCVFTRKSLIINIQYSIFNQKSLLSFEDESGNAVRVDERDIVVNNPSELILQIPALAAGRYQLAIGNNSVSVK